MVGTKAAAAAAAWQRAQHTNTQAGWRKGRRNFIYKGRSDDVLQLYSQLQPTHTRTTT